MQYIKGRRRFKEDIDIQYIIDRLNISRELESTLKNIKSPVSDFLLNVSKHELETEPYRQDNIDVSDKRSYFNFNNGKSQVKAGRLVNQLSKKLKKELGEEEFNDLFNLKEKDIQDFVDKYNDAIAERMKPTELTIVKGDDIYKAYMYCGKEGGSPLGRSCMIGKSKSKFEIYTENPEKVALATLWEDGDMWRDDGLLGRALLWNAQDGNGNDIKIMDRIYFDNADVEMKFKTWANQNGYAYRRYQDYNESHADQFVEDGENKYYDDLYVCLKDYDYRAYPYMDTFKYLDDNNCLTNQQYENSIGRLEHTDGTYENLNLQQLIDEMVTRDNLLSLTDVIKNVREGIDDSKPIMDTVDDNGLVVVGSDWSYFVDLFEGHENESFVRDVMTGDTWQYFDYSYNELGYDVEYYWDDLKERTKDTIADICKEADVKLFKAESKEEFDAYKEQNPDLDYSRYENLKSEYIKNKLYFAIEDDEVKELSDIIENNDDLDDLKTAILQGYGDAKRNADESEAYRSVYKSIVDYLGNGEYKVDYKVYIHLDPGKIEDLLNEISEYDLEDFNNSFSLGVGSLIDILDHCVRYYNIPSPEFNEPYYGFDGDPSEFIDEVVMDKLSYEFD